MKKLTVLSLIAALPALAQATTYHQDFGQSQRQLTSSEGLSILLTGENFASGEIGDTEVNTVEQIQIVVYGGPASFGSQIQALLIPNCRSQKYGTPVSEPTLTANLTPQTDGSSVNFNAAVSGVLVTSSAKHGADENVNCTPQLAIVVDGNWQTDPVNGTHNFNLNNF